ncbi:MAG: peptidylprolyl isomerase, partial [Bradymonadaceae bacterium]
MTCTSLLLCTACDSKSRGESQTPATNDRHVATSGEIPAEPKLEGADPIETAELPPSIEALQRYTEGIEGEGTLWTTLHTSAGTIRCELFEDEAPLTVANFVGL